MYAPNYLIETGWREDLTLPLTVLFVAAIIAIIAEAFVFLTKPGSRLGNAFVPIMVVGIGVFLAAGGVLGFRASQLPFNDAYWKTYEVEGRVLLAGAAELADGSGSVPMAILDLPSSASSLSVNMSNDDLHNYVGQDVTLACELIETENGAMDVVCSYVGTYQEATA